MLKYYTYMYNKKGLIIRPALLLLDFDLATV